MDNPTNSTFENLRSALAVLAQNGHANSYDTWSKMGFALKHAEVTGQLVEGEGLELFHEFSKAWQRYDSRDVEAAWKGFKLRENDPLTIGSTFHAAKECGWSFPKAEPGDFSWFHNLPWPYEIAEAEFPYFDEKGVSPPPAAKLLNGKTLMPYYDLTGKIIANEWFVDKASVEQGKANKGVLTGSKRNGAFAAYYDLKPSAELIILAEGAGTAGAIADTYDEHLGFNSVCNRADSEAFQAQKAKIAILAVGSKTNFSHVARSVRDIHPSATIIIVSDRDAETSCWNYAKWTYGVKVAVMPLDVNPEVHNFDAYDLWKEKGPNAVIQILNEAKYPPLETVKASLLPDPCPVLDFVTSPPPARKWIVANLIPANTPILLVAAGGTGKSHALLDLSFAVATGTPWAGGLGDSSFQAKKYGFDPELPRRGVLYLAAEDSRDEIQRRMFGLSKLTQHGIEDARRDFGDVVENWKLQYVRDLHENLVILPNSGSSTRLIQDGKLTSLLDDLIAKASEIPNLGLVVIEPLSRLHDANENDSIEMTRVVEMIEYISKTLGVTVMVAHHTNKTANLNAVRNSAASRGSSALVDGFRLVFQMSSMTVEEGKQLGVDNKRYVSFHVVKSNSLPPLDPVWLRREDGGHLRVDYLDTSEEAADAKILEAIKVKVEELCKADKLHSKRSFAEKFGSTLGVGRTKLEGLITKATSMGLIEQRKAKSLEGDYASAANHPKSSTFLLVVAA